VLVGSGVTIDNVPAILERADGVIIGSSLKVDGVWWEAVDRDRVTVFMCVVRDLRQRLPSARG
ncbi:MAG: hypothetical protein JOZ40_20710, partial [Methylobacteriaceae bacterium]|nr:hypothetical protein [Methylobacteriaceae bacterium]